MIRPPASFITVYMVPNPNELHALADKIHGLDVSRGTLGYAFQNDASVLAVVDGVGVGTVLHEVFHLAVRSSYGAIPQWMDEGMASLYETCTRVGDRFLGEPNWRALVFKEMGLNFVPLGQVIASPWFSDEPGTSSDRRRSPDEQAYMMAMARYFALYLQEQGQLKKVFDAYRGRKPASGFVPAATQAVQLVEGAVGLPIATIETQFRAWYPQVRDPQLRIHIGKPIEKGIPNELFERAKNP